MGDEEKFDAVVVGAGPAGTAAAITMAKAGLQVALLERGPKPGSKNVMGGILYNHYLEEIVGEEWKQAPLERPIIEERRWLMTSEAAIGLDYKNIRNREHPHSYSVLRARFDAWFAEQAEKAGAMVVPETVVDRLIVKDGRVVGVGTARGDAVYAEVTIVCEGIGLGSGLLESTVIAGRPLRRKLRADEVAMAVKEIMQLDPGLIEERFNCDPGEGCTIECFGDSTMGMSGFMFIYTNRDTLSVGGGALLSEFNKTLRTPNDLMEHFKSHPAINPLLLTRYPSVADRALDEFFRVDGTSKWDKQARIFKMLRKEGLLKMGWDTFRSVWAMK